MVLIYHEDVIKEFTRQLIKPFFTIVGIILLCTLLARFVLRGETLMDWANENPEIAFATPIPVVKIGLDIETLPDEGELEDEDEVSESEEAVYERMFVSEWSVPENMTVFRPGFSKEPINDALFEYMKGISFPITLEEAIAIFYDDEYEFEFEFDEDLEHEFEEVYALLPNIVENAEDIVISRDDLVFLSLLHYDFNGDVQLGEMICNVLIADDVLAIFYELYLTGYQLESIQLIEVYGGSDTFSMIYNNTHSFNYRESSPGRLSLHAYGLAIDVNPVPNPYVAYNNNGTIRKISPIGSEEFADRTRDFPHKIDEDDLIFILFDERGFVWGGNWRLQKDYHHFQKDLR